MKRFNQLHRRDFLTTSATAAAALTAAYLPAQDKADKLRIGCIGTGGRGTYISGFAARFGEAVMICDTDLRHAENVKKHLKTDKALVCQDYRQVLDRKDVDVIINGTPDHWHTKIIAEACLAGKDVYSEKPMTLTIDEGKLLRNVVKETKRIVQIGTQQRTSAQFQTAIELIRNGRIGKIKTVYVSIPYYQTKGGPFPKQDVPKELNWDLFQGQAPEAPYCDARTNRWRLWYDYSGGNITDWGNHHTDICLWGLNAEHTGPLSVDARALFPNGGKADCYSTPGAFFSRMKFADDVEVLFFSELGAEWKKVKEGKPSEFTAERFDYLFGKDCPDEVKETDRDGLMFIGEKGRIFVNRGGCYGKAVDELKDNPLPENAWHTAFRVPGIRDIGDSTGRHIHNFFDTVRSREQPAASVDIEQRAVTLCHLTNISIRTGRKIQWNPETEQITGDDEANVMQKRKQREPYTIS
ncbi:MAG: Gfo/Idh/MocA family oxidoreductase [Planctomycetaceae bacterium]|jgi:predicted dehydrogenase|nr:Gfo/Idh/MocA family oxidoreductase [Planctomycetaceae bacterium]